MKLKLTATLSLLVVCASAQTNVAFQNFSGATSGAPIVDNTGVPIDSSRLSLAVGTFEDAFASTLGTLDTFTADAAVVAAFTQTGSTNTFNPTTLEGLFNTSVADADNGNSLAGENAYLLVTDISSDSPQVLVFDLAATFPTQDATGAGAIPSRQLSFDDVAFGFVGDGTGVEVDTASLEAKNDGFATGFERGIAFDQTVVVPEPSTSILAVIAGLGFLSRRKR